MLFPRVFRRSAPSAKATGRLVPARHISWTQQGSRTVIMDLRKGSYHSLDELGSRIWSLTQAGLTADAVAHALGEEYDAPLDVLRLDTERFIARLQEAKWLEQE